MVESLTFLLKQRRKAQERRLTGNIPSVDRASTKLSVTRMQKTSGELWQKGPSAFYVTLHHDAVGRAFYRRLGLRACVLANQTVDASLIDSFF